MHANNNGNLFATFLLLNEMQLLIFLVRGDPSKISVQVVLISYNGSCLLWVMSTEISVYDMAVNTRSIVGRHSVDSRSTLGRQSVDTRSTLSR